MLVDSSPIVHTYRRHALKQRNTSAPVYSGIYSLIEATSRSAACLRNGGQARYVACPSVEDLHIHAWSQRLDML